MKIKGFGPSWGKLLSWLAQITKFATLDDTNNAIDDSTGGTELNSMPQHITILRNKKLCKVLFDLDTNFYPDADKNCSEKGGRFPDEPFQINYSSQENVPYIIYPCFWTNGVITADGNYSGPEEFESEAKRALDELRKSTKIELEIFGTHNRQFCLGRSPSVGSYEGPKLETVNFFCKNDLFDEKGRVKMYTGDQNSCEHQKLNRSFIVEHGLFDVHDANANFVIQNYQRREENWTDIWTRFLSGWTINEDFRASGMSLCTPEPTHYYMQYCPPVGKNKDFKMLIKEPTAFTGPSVCIDQQDC